jgi:antitoxin component YwqK of YwqJK toxin-antitoxin module
MKINIKPPGQFVTAIALAVSTLLAPQLSSAQVTDGVVTDSKPAQKKALVCRDARFRMVPDCEGLVYVDKRTVEGTERDVVFHKKTGAVYTGSCKVCHNNGNLWMYLHYQNGWSYGVDTVYYENGHINLIRSHDITGLGKEDGTWSFYREDGTLKWEKTFVMGNADGEQRYYFPDSTIEKVEMWKMGQLNGKKTEYYPGGTLKKEIVYKNGEFDGMYTTYFPDGKIESQQEFSNGKKTGASTYNYENGQLFYQEYHEGGQKEGEFKRFYLSGRKWTVENYSKDMRHGLFQEYYDDEKNTLKYEAYFKKNKLISEQYYDEFGEKMAPPADEGGGTTTTGGGEGEGETEEEDGKKKKKKDH